MLPFFFPGTGTTIASWVVGNLINWLLHGVLTVQLYLYYLAFPNDGTWTKVAVYAVYVLETVQVIGLAIILVLITVSGSAESALQSLSSSRSSYYSLYSWSKIADITWIAQAALVALVSGLVPFIAQYIYARRIRIITQRKVIPRIIITLAILQLFAALITAVFTASVLPWLALDVVNDLIIAFVMVRSLRKEKPLSDYTRSKVIRRIHLIIATGSMTVAANVLALVGVSCNSAAFKGDLIAAPLLVFMPKLYGNSILVMLNNRMTIKDSRNMTPLNMISTNVVSTFSVADHQIKPSHSEISHDEVPFLSSATNSSN